MAKTIKLLVTEIEGETCVFDADTLALSGVDESTAGEAFGSSAYWLTLAVKDATFADQQAAARESAGDETLLPQKRFVAGVTEWRKRICNEDSESVWQPTEQRFLELPPLVANAISGVLLSAWYPVATKTADFFKQLQAKQAESVEEKK